MISAEALGSLLLGLYRPSRELTMSDFQRHALAQVGRHVPFDAAWWSMATQLDNGRHHTHDSYMQGLPDDCAELLNLTDQDNLITRTCSNSPDICFNFAPEQIFGNMATALLARHMGVAHILCITWRSEIPQLVTCLSFGRRERANPFSENERRLIECLMPHLTDMLQGNRVAQIASVQARNSGARSATAATDAMGMLLAAESGFERLIQLEWPGWKGPFLPPPLLAAMAEKRDRHLGKAVLACFEQGSETGRLISIAKRSPGDLLSPRERTVAEGFASGESYKALAKRLELSPATVRHYLRIIYGKLGVADKAALATLLAEARQAANDSIAGETPRNAR